VNPQDSATRKRRAASAWLGIAVAFAKRRDGAAAVEFAVVLPVLLLMVFGILDFSRAMNYDNDATHLANEGARWAVVNANPGSGTLQSYIKSQGVTSELQNNSTVCISFPNGTPKVGDPVSVTVAVKFTWLPFIDKAVGSPGSTTMTGKAVMRLEQLPTNYSAGCA
jgi:Flp pilus assembly protein TadG